MWPGEQRKNGCHRFKASSEPFHSLIAQEFSWHFYYRASEAFAPVMERQVGPFAWNVKLQNSQSDPAAPIPVLGQGSFGQTMRKNPCLGFYYFFFFLITKGLFLKVVQSQNSDTVQLHQLHLTIISVYFHHSISMENDNRMRNIMMTE